MPSRITKTEKWSDPWFRRLKPGQKLLWLWMLDQCDLAGTFEYDEAKARFEIGPGATFKLNADFEGRVVPVGDRFFIPKFIEAQQGRPVSQLNPANSAHVSILRLVEKYGLLEILEGVSKGGLRGVPPLSQVIVKSSNVETAAAAFVPPTLAEIEVYMEGQMPAVAKRCTGITKLVFPKQEAPLFVGYYSQKDWMVKGKRMKSWQQAAYNWLIKSYQFKQEKAAR